LLQVLVIVERRGNRAIAMDIDLCTEVIEIVIEIVDLLLERGDVRRHLLEFVRLLEVVAAIGRILAFEVEVPASLTGSLPVALDLAPLAFVTVAQLVNAYE
jgi:hypothetical protein